MKRAWVGELKKMCWNGLGLLRGYGRRGWHEGICVRNEAVKVKEETKFGDGRMKWKRFWMLRAWTVSVWMGWGELEHYDIQGVTFCQWPEWGIWSSQVKPQKGLWHLFVDRGPSDFFTLYMTARVDVND